MTEFTIIVNDDAATEAFASSFDGAKLAARTLIEDAESAGFDSDELVAEIYPERRMYPAFTVARAKRGMGFETFGADCDFRRYRQ